MWALKMGVGRRKVMKIFSVFLKKIMTEGAHQAALLAAVIKSSCIFPIGAHKVRMQRAQHSKTRKSAASGALIEAVSNIKSFHRPNVMNTACIAYEKNENSAMPFFLLHIDFFL